MALQPTVAKLSFRLVPTLHCPFYTLLHLALYKRATDCVKCSAVWTMDGEELKIDEITDMVYLKYLMLYLCIISRLICLSEIICYIITNV